MLKAINKLGLRYFKAYSLNTFYLTCPQITSAIACILTLPIILRYIPGTDYGKMQFILALCGWLGVFTFVRISIESKIGIAKGYEGNFFYAIFTRLRLSIPVILLCLLTGIAFIYYGRPILGGILLLTTINLLINNIVNGSISNFLIAKELFHYYAIVESVLLLLSQAASALAAYYTHNIIYMVFAKVFTSAFLIFVFLLILLKKHGLWSAFLRKEYDSSLKAYGVKMLPADLFFLTRTSLSPLLVGTFFGFESLAAFSVAYNGIYLRTLDIVKKISPLLYSKEARNKTVMLKMQNPKYFFAVAATGLLFAFLMIACAIFYIRFFLPIEYHIANIYVVILLLSVPFVILFQLLTLSLRVKMAHRALTMISIGRTVAELFCIFILGYLFGISGVSLAILLGVIVGFYLALSEFKKSSGLQQRS